MKTENDSGNMEKVSPSAKSTQRTTRALVGKPGESAKAVLRNNSKQTHNLNSVVTTCDRPVRKKIKVHSLTGRITFERMLQAFRAVKRNRGAAGVDKVSVQMFDANRDDNLNALMRELKKGTYKPLPLRRVYIDKGPGSKKKRPLGIPIVRDRVAQEVIRGLLNPIFEPLFHNDSYGFIKRRNAHMAIERVLALHRQGHLVVLDADIKGFFDNIPHKVIMQALASEVADGNILKLVEKFLTAGVLEGGVFKPTRIGTPQGGVISPFLANIVLNRLDWALHESGYQFARYADDFVIACHTRQQAQEALDVVRHVLEGELGLSLSPEKTHIVTFGAGYEFLGFCLSSHSKRMRDKSVQKFKTKIRELTIRHHNLDRKVIEKLNAVIRGTANYFSPGFSTCQWIFQKLDSWIRMRLRCMKLKRKNYNDNRKLRKTFFRNKLGLITLEEHICQDPSDKAHRVIPR